MKELIKEKLGIKNSVEIPKGGTCRRCHINVPVNRKKICYPCFVAENLEQAGWYNKDAHPDWCKCSLTVPHIGRH